MEVFAPVCKSFKTAKRGEVCRIPIPGCTVSPAAPGAATPTVIRLPHINAELFRQFILYVYTAKLMLQDYRVFEMLTLAQDMGVLELRAACEDHVISTLSVDNACTFLTAVMDIHEKAGNPKVQKVMVQPINLIFRYLQNRSRVQVWLYENISLRIEGHIVGFDEYMNLVLDDAEEVYVKTRHRKNLGRIMLKGDNITLIQNFCLEEEEVWRCVLAWAKYQAGVTQPTAHWTEEERARVCQHLSGVMGHVRLLLIDSQVFAEEVEPTGAVPMELSLERYRYAALHPNKLVDNDKRLQPRLTVNMFPGSQILRNDKLALQGILNSWYGVPKQSWRLVYRASTHGYSSSAFHRYCDGVAPCMVIALGAHGEISGGFTDVAWAKTSRKGGYVHSERAFLFMLNPANGEQPVKFDIVKKPYAICYHTDCGPIFGAGADLLISGNCNVNTDSYSNLPHSYDGPHAPHLTLFGDYNFMVSDYEVYTVAATQAHNNPILPSNGQAPNVPSKVKYDRY
ncbi:CG7102 [Drosophila busckii]|uniref:Probable small nuclear ribonucleoprotein E n=1 Tax=Drosophila busckii TaxID=30019 RepID=A0A0M4E117_DROBS|nr:CG7102 [Drosophila busckii]